ncbi:MAG: hypothetical protein AAF346_19675 [Pseudomonadota bacterium]
MRKKILGAVLLMAAIFTAAGTVMAGPLDRFNGRWAGWGRITLDSGRTENMKCVTVFRIGKGGNSAQQSFRCSSESYRFDAKANYKVAGGKVTASWNEAIYAMEGSIAAKMTGSGLQGTIRSTTFAGRIKISHSGRCRQTTVITPRGIEVRSLTVDLKRC